MKSKLMLSNINSISVTTKSKRLNQTEVLSKASKKTKNTYPKSRQLSKESKKTRSQSIKLRERKKPVFSKRRTLETLEDEINKTYGKQNLALPVDPILTHTQALGSPYFQTPSNLLISSKQNLNSQNRNEKKDASISCSYNKAQNFNPITTTSRRQDKTYDMIGVSNSTVQDHSRNRIQNIVKSQMNSTKVTEQKNQFHNIANKQDDTYQNKSAHLDSHVYNNILNYNNISKENSCPLDINTFVQGETISGKTYLPTDTNVNYNIPVEFVKSYQNSANTSMTKQIKQSSKKECRRCNRYSKDAQTSVSPVKSCNKSDIINEFITSELACNTESGKSTIYLKLHSPSSEIRIEKQSDTNYILKESKSIKSTIGND